MMKAYPEVPTFSSLMSVSRKLMFAIATKAPTIRLPDLRGAETGTDGLFVTLSRLAEPASTTPLTAFLK